MKLRELLLGSIAAVALTGTASADYNSPTGWYLSMGAGANWIVDGDYQSTSYGVVTSSGELHHDDGYVVAGAVGYDYGQWRVEFEVAYRDNDVDEYCYSGTCYGADTQVWELSQMVNVMYDHAFNDRWEGSIGAGIGGNLVVVEEWDSVDMDDYVFAGQLIAQLGYRLSDRWQAFADYRYVLMSDPSGNFDSDPNYGWEFEKSEHAVMLGLRFDLQRDGAAPPISRPPAGDPPKQFIVFFGFNKSNLTAEAARVVSDAAAAAKKYGSASISVVGHTDTVGSNDYNMKLSMRRSQAVKDGLIANGIAANQISTGGRGEAELMVQTGDAVKEPQNRRATIDLNN